MTEAESLTALDATFLELEQADLGAHMHIGGVMVFDPLPGGGRPELEQVRSVLGRRLYRLPRYRQRLSEAQVGGLRWPQWIEDQEFDVTRHVHRAAVPAPGGREELAGWAADFYSQRLDRSVPLWETVLLEGLERDRWALVTKTHHAMVDGVGSVDVSFLMLDSSPEPEDEEEEPESPPAPGTPRGGPAPQLPDRVRSLLGDGVRLGVQTAKLPFQAARSTIGLLQPDQAREAMERARAAVAVAREEVIPAPATSINRPIGAHRRLAMEQFDLDELKAVKRGLGGTINDVVLAATTAGLRDLLLARGEELPEQGLRAMVPVNIRTAGEHLGLGNKVTSLFVHLPVAESESEARYRKQMAEAESLKSGRQALGSQTLTELANLAPPALHSVVARTQFGTRLFNVTVTNVPGPQVPLFSFGARMRELWPLVPIAADHSIGLAVISYDGRMFFCLNADRDSTADVGVIAGGIRREIEALLRLARR
jgi:diacylglycerol O-acyltransferase